MTASLNSLEVIELLDEHLSAAAELFAAGYREARLDVPLLLAGCDMFIDGRKTCGGVVVRRYNCLRQASPLFAASESTREIET